MPTFLNERQVGFDAQSVGFPDIGACMGLALQVAGGLYGFHIMPKETDKIGAFLQFFNGHVSTGAMNHLYGCCRWSERYGATATQTDWEAEMKSIATLLGYTGPVSGFDAATGTKVKHEEAIYIELRRLGAATVSYHYKRSSKMDYTKAYTPSTSADLRGILPDPKAASKYKLSTALAFGNTSAADVKATWSNKGEIHEVKAKDVVTFNAP
jgi:hypothetical protein